MEHLQIRPTGIRTICGPFAEPSGGLEPPIPFLPSSERRAEAGNRKASFQPVGSTSHEAGRTLGYERVAETTERTAPRAGVRRRGRSRLDGGPSRIEPVAGSYARRMEQRGPAIYLITGPMAAGKSTVACLLASRFARGVHLEGDFFRRSIVSGRDEMAPGASPEALRQLRLRYRLAAAAADAYIDAGFTVAVDDVVAGALLGEYLALIRSRPCHLVVLLPSRDAVASREAERAKTGYTHWAVEELYSAFTDDTPRVGIWLDTSELTPDETVDAILTRTSSGAQRSS
jgi:chloramphenicol 3-O-phosphotransferase